MILLNVIQSDDDLALKISDYAIRKQYALQTHVDTNTVFTAVEQKRSVRLFFITKALLFTTIESDLQTHFTGLGLEIYAEPLSHLSPTLLKKLQDGIRNVEEIS